MMKCKKNTNGNVKEEMITLVQMPRLLHLKLILTCTGEKSKNANTYIHIVISQTLFKFQIDTFYTLTVILYSTHMY